MRSPNALCTWVALALFVPAAAHAVAILPASELRTVFAEANASAGPQSSSQSNGDGSLGDFAPVSLEEEARAEVDGALASASASLDSSILSDRIVASGEARGLGGITAEDGIAVGASDSRLSIAFSVDTAGLFRLTGELFSGAAFRLLESGSEILEFSSEVGTVELDEEVELLPGESYEIQSVASAVADAADSFNPNFGVVDFAIFDWRFVVVPEPGVALLVGLGLAGLGLTRRRAPASRRR